MVTEKIHGANFVVSVCGDTVKYSKRGGYLRDDEDFFGFRRFLGGEHEGLAVFEGHCRAAHRSLLAIAPPGASVTRLYGELFGGRYPHPAVEGVPGCAAVQTGVWYAPGLHFSVFDVAVQGEQMPHTYLPFRAAMAACDSAGLLTAQASRTHVYVSASIRRLSPHMYPHVSMCARVLGCQHTSSISQDLQHHPVIISLQSPTPTLHQHQPSTNTNPPPTTTLHHRRCSPQGLWKGPSSLPTPSRAPSPLNSDSPH